jgi:acetoin utilization deacetylase AcuC-like enzyme
MLLIGVDEAYAQHDPGPHHPECPARLTAVLEGLTLVGAMAEPTLLLPPRSATRGDVDVVHDATYLDRLEAFCAGGGGQLDADTGASRESWDAALLAAGAGLAAIEALEAGRGDAAFLAVRPPGHHAVSARPMGFCLINNVAVTAAALVARGQRVMIVDWDAHHGNGTQDIFATDPQVLYVSLHEWPLYPGSGALEEVGSGAGKGATVNVPLPAGATGDVYLRALDDLVVPLAERFIPDWVLVSAGFDAHCMDPLTGLELSAGDFADLTARVSRLAPRPGRLILFLEGGYDLAALRDSVSATASTLLGEPVRPEPATSGGPGARAVAEAVRIHLVEA